MSRSCRDGSCPHAVPTWLHWSPGCDTSPGGSLGTAAPPQGPLPLGKLRHGALLGSILSLGGIGTVGTQQGCDPRAPGDRGLGGGHRADTPYASPSPPAGSRDPQTHHTDSQPGWAWPRGRSLRPGRGPLRSVTARVTSGWRAGSWRSSAGGCCGGRSWRSFSGTTRARTACCRPRSCASSCVTRARRPPCARPAPSSTPTSSTRRVGTGMSHDEDSKLGGWAGCGAQGVAAHGGDVVVSPR